MKHQTFQTCTIEHFVRDLRQSLDPTEFSRPQS